MIIFLTGYRGCGKTTLGQSLAEKLDCMWIDTDRLIVDQIGRSIQEIFQEDGEARFREIERTVVETVVAGLNSHESFVISLGGGAVLDEQSRALFQRNGKCIWLTARPEILQQRISSDQNLAQRPALTDLAELDEIKQVLAARGSIYSECADYTLDTSEMSIDQVVDHILQWLPQVDTNK